MKYLFITLEIRDGEREYTHRILHTTPGNNINFAAQRYAASYWGEIEGERQEPYINHIILGTKPKKDDHWWFFGEITIRVEDVIELTENEFELMSQIFYGDTTRNYIVVDK